MGWDVTNVRGHSSTIGVLRRHRYAHLQFGFRVFFKASNVTVRQGAQGQLDGASKSTLENEFDTKNEDEAIIHILENGTVQQTEVSSNKFISVMPANTSTEQQQAPRPWR